MTREQIRQWNARFETGDYIFGKAPNAFLAAQAPRLKPGWKALAVADGEGRNGVWLAKQGLVVLSLDASEPAQAKARRLAEEHSVPLELELADLAKWTWPEEEFDVVAAIFIQFAGPELRAHLFSGMKRALKPGGLLLLEGYRPEQISHGTGGPKAIENLYTPELLTTAFRDFEILELNAYDAEIQEGPAHSGMSALIDLVARKR